MKSLCNALLARFARAHVASAWLDGWVTVRARASAGLDLRSNYPRYHEHLSTPIISRV